MEALSGEGKAVAASEEAVTNPPPETTNTSLPATNDTSTDDPLPAADETPTKDPLCTTDDTSTVDPLRAPGVKPIKDPLPAADDMSNKDGLPSKDDTSTKDPLVDVLPSPIDSSATITTDIETLIPIGGERINTSDDPASKTPNVEPPGDGLHASRISSGGGGKSH